MTTDELKKAAEAYAYSHDSLPFPPDHASEAERLLYRPLNHIATQNEIKAFLAGAAHAQRWIPVSERLPEDDSLVLVYKWTTNERYLARCNIRDSGHSRRWEIAGTEYFAGHDNITHWLPLPPAPKEEK